MCSRRLALAEADKFMEASGKLAYQEARYELVKAYEHGNDERAKFLLKVCNEIEKRTDFEPQPSEPFTFGAPRAATIH